MKKTTKFFFMVVISIFSYNTHHLVHAAQIKSKNHAKKVIDYSADYKIVEPKKGYTWQRKSTINVKNNMQDQNGNHVAISIKHHEKHCRWHYPNISTLKPKEKASLKRYCLERKHLWIVNRPFIATGLDSYKNRFFPERFFKRTLLNNFLTRNHKISGILKLMTIDNLKKYSQAFKKHLKNNRNIYYNYNSVYPGSDHTIQFVINLLKSIISMNKNNLFLHFVPTQQLNTSNNTSNKP